MEEAGTSAEGTMEVTVEEHEEEPVVAAEEEEVVVAEEEQIATAEEAAMEEKQVLKAEAVNEFALPAWVTEQIAARGLDMTGYTSGPNDDLSDEEDDW